MAGHRFGGGADARAGPGYRDSARHGHDPLHGAVVLIVGPGLVALTDERGGFTIENVPAGSYEILAQREHLSADRQMVTVTSEQEVVIDFVLRLSPIHEEVTVTATTGGRVTTFEAFNATTTLDSFDVATNPVGTLGEALESEPGIAKRGFGPGAGRPIVRGFDGDRVLVMEDGIRTGDLSSQSGEHGVNTDPNGLDRIEVVRGPATLLYGSNSVGGVVNAITPHESFKDALASGTRVPIASSAATTTSAFFVVDRPRAPSHEPGAIHCGTSSTFPPRRTSGNNSSRRLIVSKSFTSSR